MAKFGKTKHIHFIGIGGIGMSGIAELLINLGYKVSGSDIKETSVTRRLADLGGEIFLGHNEANVEGADVVVFSSAVDPNNPEISGAIKEAVPVIPRAEMLAELMRLKHGIAIAGAHGKTTTTSMVGSILTCGGLDPTVVIGGRLDIWGGSNAKLGQGDMLVAEADESDGSFTTLSPTIAVVTNLDQEHMEHYGNMERLRETFIRFINKLPFYGAGILCLDNEEIQHIIPRLRKRLITYGMTSQADLQGCGIEDMGLGTNFEVVFKGESLGRVNVGMPGEHNILNALAAVAVGLELDVDMDIIRKGLVSLGGLERRFQIKGEYGGILVLDDYAHHPTEISAALRTARNCWPERRLVVCFQPHRYTRTKDLFDRFVISFNDADVLLAAPLYSAGENPIEGISSEALSKGIREHGHRSVTCCSEAEDIHRRLWSLIREGDVVITLGAGDIYRHGERLLKDLKSRE